MFEVVNTGIAAPRYPISGTVKKGPLVLTSQIPKDPATGEVIEGDIETQARRLFQNLSMAMKGAGGSLRDVMQIIVYLVDREDGPRMNKVYEEFFTTAPFPNRATFVVASLMRPGMKIEVTATAWIGD
ncbi:MAG: RidA family protein [Pseudorhodoplanes sp.]